MQIENPNISQAAKMVAICAKVKCSFFPMRDEGLLGTQYQSFILDEERFSRLSAQ